MVRRRLRLYSYHTFLFIPFIILFLYAQNPAQTRFFMTLRTFIFGELLTLALFGGFYLLVRDRLKTGVLVTLLLFIMFQYGAIYEFIEYHYYRGRWPFNNIHRYLAAFYLLLMGGVYLFVKRSPRGFRRINYFLNVLLLLLIAFNAVRLLSSNIKDRSDDEHKAATDSIRFSGTARPNIYYVVLDGYASDAVLSRYYGFRPNPLTGELRSLGFRRSDSAVANYYFTLFSLASTLNMSFVSDLGKSDALIYDNRVFSTLRQNGYHVYHLYSGYAVTSRFRAADSTVQIEGPYEFEKTLLRYTILRLDDFLGLFARQRLESQFRHMMDLPAIAARPKFCFLHFVAPHPPFVFKSDGSMRTHHRFADHSWEPKQYYVDQLQYVNVQVTRLLRRIVASDPTAVIVLQSDHGPWISGTTPEQLFDARSHILYAVRAPLSVPVPRATSAVNTFRLLFNGLFNTQLPLLPDSLAGKALFLGDPLMQKKLEQ